MLTRIKYKQTLPNRWEATFEHKLDKWFIFIERNEQLAFVYNILDRDDVPQSTGISPRWDNVKKLIKDDLSKLGVEFVREIRKRKSSS